MSSHEPVAPAPKRKPRPYWHVDLKWIVGLLLVASVATMLFLLALTEVTNEKNGTKILTYAVAGFFSPMGLDDTTDLASVREEIAKSPDKKFYPIPGSQLAITEADLSKSPRQLRLDLFGQLAGPLYRQDPVELAVLAPQAEGKSVSETLGVAGLLTRPAHDKIANLVRYPLIVSIILGLLLIYFSYGWGRLASPGWVLIVATFVPFVLTTAFERGLIVWTEAPPPSGESIGGGLTYVASLLVPIIVASIQPVYARYFLIGTGLVLVSILGAIIWHFIKKPAVTHVDL